jgi:hypothetical protein
MRSGYYIQTFTKTVSSSSTSKACTYVCVRYSEGNDFFLSNINRGFLIILVNMQGFLKVGTEFWCIIQKTLMFQFCLCR